MKKLLAVTLGAAVALTIAFYAGKSAAAADAIVPVRLDPNKVAGLGLTAIPPDAYQDILEAGQLNMKVANLFAGKELRAEIFASTPARTNHKNRPTPGDEFVYVLNGKLVLTEPGGKVHEFLPGDSLVLPAGYTGTWEMQGDYREIAVVSNKR